jgi:predicted MPP superfamily phosphohydrolase
MSYRLKEIELAILPAHSAPIRILHFSDLQLTPARKREIRDIQSFNALEPDFVIATGDFMAHPQAVPVVLSALGGLLDRPGAFVFGSNDYFAPKLKNPFGYLTKDTGERKLGDDLDSEGLARSLEQLGWINLNHKKSVIELNGLHVELRGTDDAHLQRDHYELVQGKRADGVDLAIGVTHAPYARVLESMAADDLDLIFAGHTHGGQVRLPWIGESKALTTNCDLPTWRARGLTRVDGQPWLHISAGMGTSPFARIRVASPPEATILTLTAKN